MIGRRPSRLHVRFSLNLLSLLPFSKHSPLSPQITLRHTTGNRTSLTRSTTYLRLPCTIQLTIESPTLSEYRPPIQIPTAPTSFASSLLSSTTPLSTNDINHPLHQQPHIIHHQQWPVPSKLPVSLHSTLRSSIDLIYFGGGSIATASRQLHINTY